MRKKIRVKFVDWWKGFDINNNFIVDILKEKYDIEISDQPDYVFCSICGYEALKYNCIRVCFVGENTRIDFNIYDYGIGFDWMTFGDRYIRFPLYAIYDKDYRIALEQKPRYTKEKIRNKFCSFISSNPYGTPKRQELVKKISEYKTVDCGGKFLNNINYRVEDKLEEQKKYKFSIACESTSSDGYVTEKILQAFSAGTIPIYYGAADVVKDFNEKAFINCMNYKSFDEVVSIVSKLDQSEEEYLEMWNQPVFNEMTIGQSYAKTKELSDFIEHIVVQKKEDAFRRDLFAWGRKYEESLKMMIKCEKTIENILRIPKFFRVKR